MEEHHLLKITLYRELSTGHRDRGNPKKRYIDSVKKTLCACHTDHDQRSTLVLDNQAVPSGLPAGVTSRTREAGIK
ncbi:hypothetical protein ACOMHN_034778 [Nucella lapillus]